VWKVTWSIHNLGDSPLTILAARLPHGKFHGKEIQLKRPQELEPNGIGHLELEVRCSEAPGNVIENAFLIMRVVSVANEWLMLARFRVLINTGGTLSTTTERITAQLVGFSSGRKTNAND
jgi:hypothetical protein